MSLFGEYIQERERKEIIEQENGFATYIINGEECYIEDIYVRPEYRKTHLATKMADKIAEKAKENGCKYLTGTVNTRANNPTESMKVLLAYGFKVHSSKQDVIVFFKELK